MKKKLWILIFPILILAAGLRLYKLDQIPPSPYWEETALGYDAYSIAKTGKDHHGNPYPIIAFPSFGDYKPSGYFYAIVPFVRILGLNLLTVRLPSAIAGVVSVGILYLIGTQLFDKKTGLIAATLLAISPWAIQFSRGGWEVNLAMTFILVGSWLLLRSLKQSWLLPLSVIFFVLSMYTYHAARLFAPVIGALGGIWILFQWVRRSKANSRMRLDRIQIASLSMSIVTVAILLFPLVSNIKNASVSSRFTDTSIFSNPQPVIDSNAAIAAHGNTKIAKVLYHRYWYYGAIIVRQWVSHFSPSFLLLKGDGNFRHGGWIGLLYPIDGIFILISIFFLFRSFQKRATINYQLIALFLWIALAAIAPALVTPAPHALRFLFAVPAFILLCAYGMSQVIEITPKKMKNIAVFGVIALYTFSFASYFSQYLEVYPVKAQSDWQYGYQELYAKIGELKLPGEQVYISRFMGRPAMYYLFYTSYDPAKLQSIEPNLPKDQLELLQVDEYHFVDSMPQGKGLFAFRTGEPVPNGKIVGNVVGLDGISIWTVWRR